MISPTSSPQYFGNTPTTSTGSTKNAMGKDAFLQMLVTQLKHQDPLNPLQTDQFASQLAQFTSVEQLNNLNEAVAQQTEAAHMGALVQQTALSASLLGKEVLALGDQVTVPTAGSAKVTVDVTGTGGAATLTLKNDVGAVIATRDLGSVVPGTKTFTLPADLPPGNWHYSVDVKDSKGDTTAAGTYTSGVVTSLEFKNGSIVLHLGDSEISLTDIVKIAPASPGTPTGGNAIGTVASGAASGLAGTAHLLTGALRLLPGLTAF
jgi:flagellar basal-body rod modification protein FlgD